MFKWSVDVLRVPSLPVLRVLLVLVIYMFQGRLPGECMLVSQCICMVYLLPVLELTFVGNRCQWNSNDGGIQSSRRHREYRLSYRDRRCTVDTIDS